MLLLLLLPCEVCVTVELAPVLPSVEDPLPLGVFDFEPPEALFREPPEPVPVTEAVICVVLLLLPTLLVRLAIDPVGLDSTVSLVVEDVEEDLEPEDFPLEVVEATASSSVLAAGCTKDNFLSIPFSFSFCTPINLATPRRDARVVDIKVASLPS